MSVNNVRALKSEVSKLARQLFYQAVLLVVRTQLSVIIGQLFILWQYQWMSRRTRLATKSEPWRRRSADHRQYDAITTEDYL